LLKKLCKNVLSQTKLELQRKNLVQTIEIILAGYYGEVLKAGDGIVRLWGITKSYVW
jgi:hypothetical protein